MVAQFAFQALPQLVDWSHCQLKLSRALESFPPILTHCEGARLCIARFDLFEGPPCLMENVVQASDAFELPILPLRFLSS